MWCRDEAFGIAQNNPIFDVQMLHPTQRRRFKISQMGSIVELMEMGGEKFLRRVFNRRCKPINADEHR
jgi:hypothetical protein